MGDVILFARLDPARAAYEAEVREVCALARVPECADAYIRQNTSMKDVMSDMIEVVFGRRLPQDAARRMARHTASLIGPAGSRRRPMPKNFGQYGAMRQP